MTMRSTGSTVTLRVPFALSGYPEGPLSGACEVLLEEELLRGFSFEAGRRTATRLTVRCKGGYAGRAEMRDFRRRPERGAEPRE